MKIRLADGKTKKIKLNETDSIEVLKNIEYDFYKDLVKIGQAEQTNAALIIPFLQKIIVGWEVLDDEGQQIPFSVENISKIDGVVALELFQMLQPDYMPEKKSLPQSDEQSSAKTDSEPVNAASN